MSRSYGGSYGGSNYAAGFHVNIATGSFLFFKVSSGRFLCIFAACVISHKTLSAAILEYAGAPILMPWSGTTIIFFTFLGASKSMAAFIRRAIVIFRTKFTSSLPSLCDYGSLHICWGDDCRKSIG